LGLSVTGQVPVANLRLKKGGVPGDLLVLTKPLGTGLLFAAARAGLLSALPEEAVTAMQRLNDEGPVLAALSEVHAMTDITGFGLLGHLVEICRASRVRAILTLGRIPFFPLVGDFSQMDLPHPAARGNWEAVRATVNEIPAAWGRALSDPQINGGLLFSVSPERASRAEDVLSRRGLPFTVIGELAPESSGSPIVEIVS
jgi:selenide,water dikinase